MLYSSLSKSPKVIPNLYSSKPLEHVKCKYMCY